jgi:phosphate transport system permease protein
VSNDHLGQASWLDSAAVKRSRRRSAWIDRGATLVFALGGLSVIGTLLLIVVYLVIQVAPLFQSPSMTAEKQFPLPAAQLGSSVYVAVERPSATGFRLTASGHAVSFSLHDGRLLRLDRLPLPADVSISAVAEASSGQPILALGLSNGSVMLLRYHASLAGAQTPLSPSVFTLEGGSQALAVGGHAPIEALALAEQGSGYFLLAHAGSKSVAYELHKPEDASLPWQSERFDLPPLPVMDTLLVSPGARWVLALDVLGRMRLAQWQNHQLVWLLAEPVERYPLLDMAWLAGGESLVTLAMGGAIKHWILLPREGELAAQPVAVRELNHGGAPSSTRSAAVPSTSVTTPSTSAAAAASAKSVAATAKSAAAIANIAAERRRRVFLVLDADGIATLYHATSGRNLLSHRVSEGGVTAMALSDDGGGLLIDHGDAMAVWRIVNPHPEISLRALWGKIWYEGYEQPDYVWQSTDAGFDYEPKFSLAPLLLGTFKAAFYALLVALPLAIGGALYTAYFMNPGLREQVKPLIELMEALPTVVIGFVAVLWLAPLLEAHLLMVLLLPVALPVVTIVLALLCHRLSIGQRATGWLALLLAPVVLLVAVACYHLSPVLEHYWFGGDFYVWLTESMGVDFVQRNAMLVGIALGFAVIPTIFSLVEDVIYLVPRHLSMGALALGARPWQALLGVVLPTAAPGIFSAIMIGFGRVAGETMIVLMVTGNTPIMNMNVFEGMRTVAANLAVEAPESAVASSHFRVLFLAGLVLFVFTFVLNTLAELVRQRFRRRYAEV